MEAMMDILIQRNATTLATQGLLARGHPDLVANVGDFSLVNEGISLLNFLADYVIRERARILPGQTVGYGYWLTQFMLRSDGLLEAWESNAQGTEYIPGVQLTLTYWRDQHEVCRRFAASFTPPLPESLIAISEGVLEGEVVQGVRYPSPPHMTGWWITTDRYDGHVDSLRNEHAYHITAARPELAKYLALPYGFRLDLSRTEDVWFDEAVANRDP